MSGRWYLLAAVAAIGSVASIAGAAPTAPGDLDTSFGTDGRVGVPIGSSDARGLWVAVQPDRKIVIGGTVVDYRPPPPPPPPPPAPPEGPPARGAPAGSDYGDFLALRLTPDGSLDSSFGDGGIVRTPIDLIPDGQDVPGGGAVGPDGTILLGGSASAPNGNTDFAFVRYTPDGDLDPTFSDDGIDTIDIEQYDFGAELALQPDGKIVSVGEAANQNSFSVIRLLPNGDLDPDFGSGGVVHTQLGVPAERDIASSVQVLDDGRIVVIGTADSSWPLDDYAAVRYLPNGELDESFGDGGIAIIPAERAQWAYASAVMPDGKLVIGGQAEAPEIYRYESRLVRLLPDGTLDETFGDDGVVTEDFGDSGATDALTVDPDGKLISAGFSHDINWQNVRFALARYNDDGTLDTGFGDGGVRSYSILGVSDYGLAVALQPVEAGSSGADAKLIQVGEGWDGSKWRVAASRVLLGPAGPPPRLPPPPPPPPPPPHHHHHHPAATATATATATTTRPAASTPAAPALAAGAASTATTSSARATSSTPTSTSTTSTPTSTTTSDPVSGAARRPSPPREGPDEDPACELSRRADSRC